MSDYLRQRTRERREQFGKTASNTTPRRAKKTVSPLSVTESPDRTVFTLAPRLGGGFFGLFKRTIGPAETVTITRKALALAVNGGTPREFALEKMYNPRVLVTEGGNSNRAPAEIRFEYGAETVSFAVGLEKADAKRIFNVLRERMTTAFQ
jgi:hypothetical protein